MPLGILRDANWEEKAVQLSPGDMLVLYTDGLTEASSPREEFFGEERLLDLARSNLGHSAQEVQDALMEHVHQFVGDAPQFDDITLAVVVRE
jgi:sigma-B regulation protein RsbU (phosphoserine phosphatase)